MFVVEDGDGTVVGCWAVLAVLHAEGIWIHPDHRQKGSVARRLLSKMANFLRGHGVITHSMDPHVTEYLTRLGAIPIPGQAYFWHLTQPDTSDTIGHPTEACDTSGA